MEIRYATEAQIRAAAKSARVRVQVEALNRKGDRHSTKLDPDYGATKGGYRASGTKREPRRLAPYQRTSSDRSKRTGLARPLMAVCWHGHLHFLRALYAMCPTAKVRVRGLRLPGNGYDSLEDLEAKKFHTFNRNVGSMVEPAAYGTLCECPSASSHVPLASELKLPKRLMPIPTVAA